MTNLTPQQLEVIAQEQLGKTRNIQLGLDLHAELYIYMRKHKPELNDNVSALIREACWFYLNRRSEDSIAHVAMIHAVRDTIRQEMGRIKVVTQEVSCPRCEGNGEYSNEDGWFTCEDCNGTGVLSNTIKEESNNGKVDDSEGFFS